MRSTIARINAVEQELRSFDVKLETTERREIEQALRAPCLGEVVQEMQANKSKEDDTNTNIIGLKTTGAVSVPVDQSCPKLPIETEESRKRDCKMVRKEHSQAVEGADVVYARKSEEEKEDYKNDEWYDMII